MSRPESVRGAAAALLAGIDQMGKPDRYVVLIEDPQMTTDNGDRFRSIGPMDGISAAAEADRLTREFAKSRGLLGADDISDVIIRIIICEEADHETG